MKLGIIIVVVWCLPNITSAQSEWWKTESTDEGVSKDSITTGKVTINKSPKIEKLVTFKGKAIPPEFEPTMDGYRVQIYFDQEGSAINEARASFLEEFPDEKTYIIYNAPNYNLLIGDFRDELAAEKKRAEIANEFPESIIMKSRIHLPQLKDKD